MQEYVNKHKRIVDKIFIGYDEAIKNFHSLIETILIEYPRFECVIVTRKNCQFCLREGTTFPDKWEGVKNTINTVFFDTISYMEEMDGLGIMYKLYLKDDLLIVEDINSDNHN